MGIGPSQATTGRGSGTNEPLLRGSNGLSSSASSDGGGGGSISQTVGVARSISERVSGGSRSLRHQQSMRVRETAAEHFESVQRQWVTLLIGVWFSVAFDAVLCFILSCLLLFSMREKNEVMLRTYVSVYTAAAFIHALLVWLDYARRQDAQRIWQTVLARNHMDNTELSSALQQRADGQGGTSSLQIDGREEAALAEEISPRWSLRMFSALSSLLWVNFIFGLFTVFVFGDQAPADGSHFLYWTAVLMLSISILYALLILCISTALYCCLVPILIFFNGRLQPPQDRGARASEINVLPRFKFKKLSTPPSGSGKWWLPGAGPAPSSPHTDAMLPLGSQEISRTLSTDHAHCAICISHYEDGDELRELPCHHHYHTGCIDHWLRVNAVCPLCRSSIRDGQAAAVP